MIHNQQALSHLVAFCPAGTVKTRRFVASSHLVAAPLMTMRGSPAQTLDTLRSWMAHCLPPELLVHTQRNQGVSVWQCRVRAWPGV